MDRAYGSRIFSSWPLGCIVSGAVGKADHQGIHKKRVGQEADKEGEGAREREERVEYKKYPSEVYLQRPSSPNEAPPHKVYNMSPNY